MVKVIASIREAIREQFTIYDLQMTKYGKIYINIQPYLLLFPSYFLLLNGGFMHEQRLTDILKSDRIHISKNYPELIKKDIRRVLINYFDGITNMELQIMPDGKTYKIKLSFEADGIKSVGSV